MVSDIEENFLLAEEFAILRIFQKVLHRNAILSKKQWNYETRDFLGNWYKKILLSKFSTEKIKRLDGAG